MLRIIQSVSVGQAKKYYSEGLTREGYYSEGQEFAGQWGGIAAQKLGLSGTVNKDAFSRLCDNLHPETGSPLTIRTKNNRRVGYDFNFHAPKSLTLAYEWHQDERILAAFRQSVSETMQELERDAAARVRSHGRNEDRKTGNLVWGEFIHFTARPVNGVPDPHLHAHCFTFNATFDEHENKWKAAQLGDIKSEASYYEAAFRSRLAEKIKALGYEIEPVGESFELAGISRALIEKFSRRSKVIEAKAKELGVTTASEKDGLAAMTRERKAKDLSKTELHQLWWGRLSPEEKMELESLTIGLQRSYVANQPDRNREAIEFAVKHRFYSASVVTERELITEALKWGYGRATVSGITAAVKEFPLLRVEKDGRKLVTTMEVLLEEEQIVDQCKNGLAKFPPLHAHWRIQDERLNYQQKNAVFHVLGSRDWITGIIGKAGTGKTTTLQEAGRGVEAAGKKVMAFAPTAGASRGTLRESGFPGAETVDRLLSSPQLHEQARGAVWFVDEGGLMSARSTNRLLDLARRLEARVVLVGDTGQHHSVERGDAFRLLQESGGMSVVTIDIIQRQKGLYKQAVKEISQRKFAEAFGTLERMNAIYEIPDNETRYNAIAADYVAAVKAGKKALLVAPTHIECNAVTHKVRHTLKENGTIGEGKKWHILRNLSWSPAEKGNAHCYTPGLVVKISGHVKGFSMGEQMEVVETKDGEVKLRGRDGRPKLLPLQETERFNVFERDAIEICEGDRLRITVNSRSEEGHQLSNGNIYDVKGFSPDGKIILENGWRLNKDFAHLAYGYTSTSHAAQSKTIDRILVAQSGVFSTGAGDANQFYTTVSRGRELVHIYTDDLDGLRENVARVRERLLATQVMEPKEEVTMSMSI